jgi:hypothetical protein
MKIEDQVKIGGIYIHFKSHDKRYIVKSISLNCDNPNKKVVNYEQLYSTKKFPKGTVWHRPIKEFLGYKYINGKKIKRFKLEEN